MSALRRNGDSHGRRLATELKADSGAVARCLVRLEQRGLVRSLWVGRTRLYQAARSKEARVDPLIDQAIGRLKRVKDPRPLAILPFGSRVTGSARPDSDLDIIVVVPDGQNTMGAWTRLRAALRDFPVDVDLLVYSKSSAQEWAGLPANPLRDALDLEPIALPDFLVA